MDLKRIYKEVQKRLDEEKLVVVDMGIVNGIHRYQFFVMFRDDNRNT